MAKFTQRLKAARNVLFAKDNSPIRVAGRGKEIGETGTSIYAGQISDDYNEDFHTTQGPAIFEKMMCDPMVRAVIQAVKLPIEATKPLIKAGEDTPKGKEMAEFIEQALFEEMEKPLDQMLSEILYYPFYGFYYFEKVLKIKDGKIFWKKWASRVPSAHYKWEMQDKPNEPGVTQQLPTLKQGGDTSNPEIPMSKLILFVHDQRGDNYDGFSMLRSAYRPWFDKDVMYRIQVTTAERGAGVLKITLPKGHNPQDKSDAEELGENFKFNEKSYLILPNSDWNAELMTAGISEKASNNVEMIRHYNEMIAMNILAQFIVLGSGTTGSFALSKDQSDFFTLGLRAIANKVAYVINTQAIKELIDLNFGEQEKYPTLEFPQIGQIDYAELATALSTLAGSNLVDITNEERAYIHNTFGLPRVTVKDLDERDKKEEKEQEKNKKENPDNPSGSSANPDSPNDDKGGEDTTGSGGGEPTQPPAPTDNPANKETVVNDGDAGAEPPKKKEMSECGCKHLAELKFPRELTLAEKRVKFSVVNDFYDSHAERVKGIVDEYLLSQKDGLLKKVESAIKNGDTKAVEGLTIKTTTLMSKIKEATKDAIEFGKSQASGEVDAVTPSTPAVTTQLVNTQIDQMMNEKVTQLENEMKTSVLNSIATGVGVAGALLGIKTLFDKRADAIKSTASGSIAGVGVNAGRAVVFDKAKEKTHGIQRSEILDTHTCAMCLSIDGRVMDVDDPFAKLGQVHTNCRGINVAILKSDAELPKATGLPQSIKSRFETTGGVPTVNNFKQLPDPKIKKSSRAQQKIDDGDLTI